MFHNCAQFVALTPRPIKSKTFLDLFLGKFFKISFFPTWNGKFPAFSTGQEWSNCQVYKLHLLEHKWIRSRNKNTWLRLKLTKKMSRVQYWEYFPSFSYFATYLTFRRVKIIAKYEKGGKYLPILHEATCDNYFIFKCSLKSNLATVFSLTYLHHWACLKIQPCKLYNNNIWSLQHQ